MTTMDPHAEPDPEELPDKPQIEQMPDENRDVGPGEPVPEEEFLDPEVARDDDTVDDTESDVDPPGDPEDPES